MRWPGARQRLLVLLLCLNAALPLIYLSVSRIAISDPATGGWLGDTGSYIHMYDGVPLDSIPKPFRYRILAPYLARLVPPLPASIASLYQITPDKLIKFRFGAVDFLGLTGAAYFTFLLCETLGFAAAECMIASLLFMTGFPVVNFAGLPLTDAVSYFFLVAAIVCVLRDWDLGLLVMVAVGMLAKETTAFVLVPILALELPLAARLRKLLLALPGIAAYLVFRFVIRPTTLGWNYSLADTLENLRATLTSGRRLLWIGVDGSIAFGVVWLLALAGAVMLMRAGKWRDPMLRLALLVPVAIAAPILAYANIGRLFYLTFPAVLPLAMLPVERLLSGRRPEETDATAERGGGGVGGGASCRRGSANFGEDALGS